MHAASVMRMCHYGTVKGILYSALVWCSLPRMHDAVLIQLVIKLTLVHRRCFPDEEGNSYLFTHPSHTQHKTLSFYHLTRIYIYIYILQPIVFSSVLFILGYSLLGLRFRPNKQPFNAHSGDPSSKM